MAKKQKQRQKQKRSQARKQKQRRKEKRRQDQPGPSATPDSSALAGLADLARTGLLDQLVAGPESLPEAPLVPPRPERCRRVRVGPEGRVEDPWEVLGLDPGERDPERIRASWREAALAHAPERDPDGARRVREARDLLLDPKRFLERELGELHVPDPAAWELPVAAASSQLDPRARLAAQALLYILVEDELCGTSSAGAQVPLFPVG